jgi:hypothetical protein
MASFERRRKKSEEKVSHPLISLELVVAEKKASIRCARAEPRRNLRSGNMDKVCLGENIPPSQANRRFFNRVFQRLTEKP